MTLRRLLWSLHCLALATTPAAAQNRSPSPTYEQIGALVQGQLADAIGPRATEVLVGGIVLAIAAVLVVRRDSLEALNAHGHPADVAGH